VQKTSKKVKQKMDFNLSLRRAMKTGEVKLGQNSVEKIIADNKAELVIIAKNAPAKVREMIAAKENLSLYEFNGSSRQLGKECGRDHMISVLAVVNAGESDILSLKSA
jgi:large subunit ribosomal protein L30e